MATSEAVWKTALDLAERGEDNDTAVHELLACCGDHRVSVVVARQTLSDASGEDPPGLSHARWSSSTWYSNVAAGPSQHTG